MLENPEDPESWLRFPIGSRGVRAAVAGALLEALLASVALAEGPLTFRDATAERLVQRALDDLPTEKVLEVGDFDRDGDLDVAIAMTGPPFAHAGDAPLIGPRANRFYRNDAGVLVDATAEIIPGFLAVADTSRAVFLRDYDRDGWLDLVVVNDAIIPGLAGKSRYFANRESAAGSRVYVEETGRLRGAGGPSCGAASADWNGDGFIDLYVGNYPVPADDTLYFNDGSGFFNHVTAGRVRPDNEYTVDVSTADLDGDGDLDVLVGNHFDRSWLYLNQLAADGHPGDFDESPSPILMLGPSQKKPAFEPADFDLDGRIDLYVSNHAGSRDLVLHNRGNDADGLPIFEMVAVPPLTSTQETAKATVADLDGDGRVDVVAMSPSGRPAILRNTSVPGAISFVDWTPGSFPAGPALAGAEAAILDVDADGRLDLLLGGFEREHLFLGARGEVITEASASVGLPAILDADPVAIEGEVAAGGRDRFELGHLDPFAQVSVVLSGCGDLALELFDGGRLVGRSDRGGAGVEEAMQVAASGAALSVEVMGVSGCGGGTVGTVGTVADYRLELLARSELCMATATTLCLGDGRFSVTVDWRDFEANPGAGTAIPLSRETGGFWFFDPANLELMVKVLDGTAINGSFWVFGGALTNVGYTIRIYDHQQRRLRLYDNPPGRFASFADTAFSHVAVAPARWRAAVETVPPTIAATATLRAADPESEQVCAMNVARLCLRGRFEVSVGWVDGSGNPQVARARPLTSDTGSFWFFDEANYELVVKVLDGRSINGHQWVFYGALSDVEFDLTVTDSVAGQKRTYHNPAGRLASAGAIEAFP